MAKNNSSRNEPKGSLTESQLRALKKEIAESLSRDRHKLLLGMPFCGNVSMRFDLIPVRDRRCRTACTDFKNIYVDCDFYMRLKPEERVFVLAHEIWHSVTLTAQRRMTRDPVLWNAASDMEINNILKESDSGGAYRPFEGLLFPPSELKGESAETIYDWLLKKQKENKLDESIKNSSEDCKKGKLKGQFDRHEYENDSDGGEDESGGAGDGEGGGKGDVTDQWGEVGYDDDFRPSIPADAAERMREAAISAAQQYQRERGSLPAGIEGVIGKLAKPEISWREHLSQFVSSIPNGRRTWLPPNRRYVHSDMYFQSRRGETLKVAVCIDTSGSCQGDLPKFFGELKGLVQTFSSYNIDVIQADAAVDRVDHYDHDNPIPLEYGETIETCGGGGTDYGPAFRYIDENLDPDCVIYLGDGYAGMSYDGPPRYPVLFVITKDGTFDFCDWGKKIRFKETGWE